MYKCIQVSWERDFMWKSKFSITEPQTVDAPLIFSSSFNYLWVPNASLSPWVILKCVTCSYTFSGDVEREENFSMSYQLHFSLLKYFIILLCFNDLFLGGWEVPPNFPGVFFCHEDTSDPLFQVILQTSHYCSEIETCFDLLRLCSLSLFPWVSETNWLLDQLICFGFLEARLRQTSVSLSCS